MSYQVNFPYLGNQGILVSDRIHLHARTDSVLILGKQAVGISSTNAIAIESGTKITLDSQKIELGLDAQQNIILGAKFFKDLKSFLDQVIMAGKNLQNVNQFNLAGSMMIITAAGGQLQNGAQALQDSLSSSLSKKSYVK